jgi:hypothetical protein
MKDDDDLSVIGSSSEPTTCARPFLQRFRGMIGPGIRLLVSNPEVLICSVKNWQWKVGYDPEALQWLIRPTFDYRSYRKSTPVRTQFFCGRYHHS